MNNENIFRILVIVGVGMAFSSILVLGIALVIDDIITIIFALGMGIVSVILQLTAYFIGRRNGIFR